MKSFFLIAGALAGGVLVACSSGGQNEKQLSRAGEVQYMDRPIPVQVMLLQPRALVNAVSNAKKEMRTFYASHVNGMYITQGDIILDTDEAMLKERPAAESAAQSGKASNVAGHVKFGKGVESGFARLYGTARAESLMTSDKIFLMSSHSMEARGAYVSPGGGYAYMPPMAGMDQGAYIKALNARWQQPIPYCISDDFDSDAHSYIESAVQMWHDGTGLAFAERPPGDCENSRVSMMWFTPGAGCASYVGRLITGINTIYLYPNCDDAGGVAHEIGHALGLFHEQDRPDRDDYITVNKDNITPGFESQFEHDPRQGELKEFGPYDCGSIMQYPTWAFQRSRQVNTIEPHPNCIGIGQRKGPDAQDLKEIKYIYNLGS